MQDVGLHDMVAYKDAVRHHVCLGDKVLAPWQPDGRYGPGTVLDGVDRRDPQPEGKVNLLNNFRNFFLLICTSITGGVLIHFIYWKGPAAKQ